MTTTPVFDYRDGPGNIVVEPEIRARFIKVGPDRTARMHSHDVAGELFLVLEGTCEFVVDGEGVVCTPGQVIYVPPRVRHSLHSLGEEPCWVFLTVTPHVEPTHTRYDEHDQVLPPQYGSWRGGGRRGEVVDPYADVSTPDQARAVAAQYGHLLTQVQQGQAAVDAATSAIADGAADPQAEADQVWASVHQVLRSVSDLERDWNELALRSLPPEGSR